MKKINFVAAILLIAINVSGQNAPAQAQGRSDSAGKIDPDTLALYGLIPQRPIKVGGGPANQRKYLESLRDPQGKKVTYERKGSCCEYKSESREALFGMGMLDIYEITFRDSASEKKKNNVYITFYDYEEPKPINGFTIKN